MRAVILHVHRAIRVRERVNEQNVVVALHDLKRVRQIRRARNARQDSTRLRDRSSANPRDSRRACASASGRYGNLAFLHDALPCRHGADGAEPPEILELRRGVALEIPVGRVHGLPNAVQVRVAADPARRRLSVDRSGARQRTRPTPQPTQPINPCRILPPNDRGSSKPARIIAARYGGCSEGIQISLGAPPRTAWGATQSRPILRLPTWGSPFMSNARVIAIAVRSRRSQLVCSPLGARAARGAVSHGHSRRA